jgi:mRNA interferase YafQ
MTFKIVETNGFQKLLFKAKLQGRNISLLEDIITKLASDERLDPKYRDHKLKGALSSCRECHILPDWLLVYKQDRVTNILYLISVGSHSKLKIGG